jgi:DNA end-binding protein Ku
MADKTRSLWKGAISFGLVNIPVTLHSATKEAGIDFDWLDKRTMDHVGYKRINKKTGEEIETENIVKGFQYEKDHYVVLSDEEIHGALARSTQTIELEYFVSSEEIPLQYFEQPYYLAPAGSAGKAYSLLAETLKRTKKVGIGRIVLHNRQHAAAILPEGPALIIIFLRWTHQLRLVSELELTAPETGAVTEAELSISGQLVAAMTSAWNPQGLKDSFTDKVMALVEKKVNTGQISSVPETEEAPFGASSGNVIDLSELLKQSLLRKTQEEKLSGRGNP